MVLVVGDGAEHAQGCLAVRLLAVERESLVAVAGTAGLVPGQLVHLVRRHRSVALVDAEPAVLVHALLAQEDLAGGVRAEADGGLAGPAGTAGRGLGSAGLGPQQGLISNVRTDFPG